MIFIQPVCILLRESGLLKLIVVLYNNWTFEHAVPTSVSIIHVLITCYLLKPVYTCNISIDIYIHIYIYIILMKAVTSLN